MSEIIILKENLEELKQIPTIIGLADNEKEKFYNCATGEMSSDFNEIANDNPVFFVPFIFKKILCGWSTQRDENLDMLCMIYSRLDLQSICYKRKEKREWKEFFRFYIDRKKNIYIKDTNNPNQLVLASQEKRKDILDYFLNDIYCINEGLYRNDLYNLNHDSYFNHIRHEKRYFNFSFDAIKSMFPLLYMGQYNFDIKRINNGYDFVKFLQYIELKKKKCLNQKKIDAYTSISLPEITERPKYKSSYDEFCRVAYMDRVPNMNACVIRMFYYFDQNNSYHESVRVYVFERNSLIAKKNNIGEWVYDKELENSGYNFRFIMQDVDWSATENTCLEKYKNFIDKFNPDLKTLAMVQVLLHPVFEKLYFAGYPNMVKHTFLKGSSRLSSPIHELEMLTGKTKHDASSMYAIFGMNKSQFKTLFGSMERIGYDTGLFDKHLARAVKCIIDKNDKHEEFSLYLSLSRHFMSIADVDDVTFLKMVTFLRRVSLKQHYWAELLAEALSMVRWNYGLNTTFSVISSLKDIMDKTNRDDRFFELITTYRDYVNMVVSMELTNRFKATFSNEEELKSIHDDVLELYNYTKTDRDKKKFKQRSKEWKKWEYTNEDYVVVAPSSPDDLSYEGHVLRHCVKSYIEKVANGRTNILFIRKKCEIDKPFFTVEISNEGCIEQIHGFSNRNINTEPGLKSFVDTWIKAKDLKANTYNKIR